MSRTLLNGGLAALPIAALLLVASPGWGAGDESAAGHGLEASATVAMAEEGDRLGVSCQEEGRVARCSAVVVADNGDPVNHRHTFRWEALDGGAIDADPTRSAVLVGCPDADVGPAGPLVGVQVVAVDVVTGAERTAATVIDCS